MAIRRTMTVQEFSTSSISIIQFMILVFKSLVCLEKKSCFEQKCQDEKLKIYEHRYQKWYLSINIHLVHLNKGKALSVDALW